MITRSGRELHNLSELIEYYKVNLDGLPILLKQGTNAYDPAKFYTGDEDDDGRTQIVKITPVRENAYN